MKQRTWTHAIKQTEESEKTCCAAPRRTVLLLRAADVGRQPAKVHRALWTFARSGKAVSMHCRARRGEMRWRQGRRGEHRRGLPFLQRDAAQGEASRGRGQTCVRRALPAGKGQVAPAAGQGSIQQTKNATCLSQTGSTIIPSAISNQGQFDARKTSTCQNVSFNVSLEVSKSGLSVSVLAETLGFAVIGEESHPLRHLRIIPMSSRLEGLRGGGYRGGNARVFCAEASC